MPVRCGRRSVLIQTMQMLLDFILVIIAYLLGSIPSSVWIGKRFYGVDVRRHGSHNAGATNTLRVLGRRAALPVFAIDFLKGFAAVKLSLIAVRCNGYAPDSVELFALQMLLIVAAVAGHIFPVFAGFKGGKGVATIAGTMVAVATVPTLLALGVFVAVLAVSHYVSLGSIVASVCFPVILVLYHADIKMVIFGIVVALLLIFTHRKNIGRLVAGTESKIYLVKRRNSDSSGDVSAAE